MCSLQRRGRVYILTLTGTGEHRLNPSLLSSISSALASIRSDAPSGCALVTAGEGKFFSNGYDLSWVRLSPSDRVPLLRSIFRRTLADLASLPMPTVAAVTGHAAAAGLVLALAHDHRVMRGDRGFLYMSELDLGLRITDEIMAPLRSKVRDPATLAKLLLKAKKVTADEAAGMGIVDRTAGSAREAVEVAVAMAEQLARRDWNGEVYASIRLAAFPEMAEVLGLGDDERTEEQILKKMRAKM